MDKRAETRKRELLLRQNGYGKWKTMEAGNAGRGIAGISSIFTARVI